ncbi:MAG: hypothetical protein GY749_31935, partial [Desulfobacteraceae bacterium]|nr:hypothetical protein [Desulfobacteraceae bacterium]
INGSPQELTGGDFTLPGGGIINRSGSDYTITWPMNSGMVKIDDSSWGLLVRVYITDLQKGQLIGLLGDADGNPQNDIVTRDGVNLGTDLLFDELYPEYANSWRISQEESLFDYAPGETTETFTDHNFPRIIARYSDLSTDDRAYAEQICRQAGITNPVLLEDCILDVALTGEQGFAQLPPDLADPQVSVTVTPPPPPEFGAPGFGRFEGVVYDGITKQTLNDAQVSLTVNGNPLPGITIHATENGAYTTDVVPVGAGYRLLIQTDGYISEQVFSLHALDRQITEVEPVYLVSAELEGMKGNITGTARNALDNSSISSLNISVRRYINNRISEILKTTQTDQNGNFKIPDLYSGNYTLEFQGDGFLTNYVTSISIGGNTTISDVIISPELGNALFRIVLSWSDSPRDLDAHLTGPDGEGERFHIYWLNEGNANPDAVPYAWLDRDDRDGYGPETITIARLQQAEDVYRYSVNNFSNYGATSNNALANSNAKVEIYSGNSLIETFYVPNQEGTLWTVFEIDESGKLTTINEMGYESNQGGIISRSASERRNSIFNLALPVETDYWPIMYQSAKKKK